MSAPHKAQYFIMTTRCGGVVARGSRRPATIVGSYSTPIHSIPTTTSEPIQQITKEQQNGKSTATTSEAEEERIESNLRPRTHDGDRKKHEATTTNAGQW